MHVLVIGATKGTGRLLADRLRDAGNEVRALVRDPDGADAGELRDAGIEVIAGDLADPDPSPLRTAVDGVDAVAFCAGSGSTTGKDQTLLVDLHGAVRAVDAADAAGVDRFVILSSISAGDPWGRGVEAIAPYLAAKHAADRVLAASGLGWTVVRPGALTHDTPTGRVRTAQPAFAPDELGDRSISRADVATVMASCLTSPTAVGASFELLSGDTPIGDALAALTPCAPHVRA